MRLLVALGVSAAVHGGALLVVWARPAANAVEPAAVSATRVTLFDVVSPRRAAPVIAPPKRAAARRVTVAAAAPAGASAAEEIATVPEAPAGDAVVAAPAAETAAMPAAPARRAFDVTALHAALAESARRCYPPAAKRYHLTGEAQVDFCLDGAGALSSTKLLSSTGQQLLDAAARECVISGALPLPAEASGGCYSVPVRFR